MPGRADHISKCCPDPGAKRLDVNRVRQLTGSHPLPLLGQFDTHLLDRHVVRQAAVVLGQPLVKVDAKTTVVRERFGGLDSPALGTADHPTDREAFQRLHQTPGLLPTKGGQFRIGALAGSGTKR